MANLEALKEQNVSKTADEQAAFWQAVAQSARGEDLDPDTVEAIYGAAGKTFNECEAACVAEVQ